MGKIESIEKAISGVERTFTEVQNFGAGATGGLAKTGTELDLSNVLGNNYNYGAASSETTYTTVNPVVNGYAICLINAPTEPTVTGATKISGATFTADTDMEIVIESPDGVSVRYFFLEL